jgi:hypothetical protein
MKIKNIFTLLVLLLSVNFYAQEKNSAEKREQIHALKIAFISNNLSLTANEAEKFWPIYNAFEEKQYDLKYIKSISYIKKMDDEILNKMSDKEALQVLSRIEANEEELFQLRKKLMITLKSIISPVKIIKLKKAEDEFNKKLLQQYRNKGPRG